MDSIRPASGQKHLIKLDKYGLAVIELTCAAVIWGASFTLVRWALVDFSASTLIFWRLIVAFVAGELIHFFSNPKLFKSSWSDSKLSMLAGIFLGLSLIFQTYGLNFTTATNSGFITSMYVVLIPVIGALFFKHKIKPHHILLSMLAFTGMGFLLSLDNLNIQRGELLTVVAAITAAFQIIFVGRVARHAKSAFRFNTYQTFWSWVAILPFLVLEVRIKDLHLWPQEVHLKSMLSMLGLAFFVSVFAFYLQIRAQRILSTTTSSMLCLLEGPFAFFFAAFFLAEKLGGFQFFGAFIILLSCALSVFMDRPKD